MKHINIVVMATSLSLTTLYAQEDSISSPETKKNSFGLGLGIPYGFLGGNVDINVVPNLNLSAGIGTTLLAGIAYNIGLKYFFTPVEKPFRPRLSAYYGINAAVEKTVTFASGSSTEKATHAGINLGIGVQWMWGETKSGGLDFDVIYIATTGLDAEQLRREGFTLEEPGKVKISTGYRHAF